MHLYKGAHICGITSNYFNGAINKIFGELSTIIHDTCEYFLNHLLEP